MKKKIQLKEICWARSGDKGDISNIGLMAKKPEYYDIIKKQVTPERVKSYFRDMVKGTVDIYEAPNLDSLEIVMHQALDGGATRTLRLDETGKCMGENLLQMEIEMEEMTTRK